MGNRLLQWRLNSADVSDAITFEECDAEPNVTMLLLCIFLGLGTTVGGIALANWVFLKRAMGSRKSVRMWNFGWSAIVALLVGLGAIAYSGIAYWDPCYTFAEWWRGANYSITSVFVGMGGNIVFGFIDNVGLWLGLSTMETRISELRRTKDANLIACYGNLISDFMGAFLGTYVNVYLVLFTGVSDYPIWSQAVGVAIGCLLGAEIPYLALKKRASIGLNRLSYMQTLLLPDNCRSPALYHDMWKVDIGKVMIPVLVKAVFMELDTNRSGTIDYSEVLHRLRDFDAETTPEMVESLLSPVHPGLEFQEDPQLSLTEFAFVYIRMLKNIIEAAGQWSQEELDTRENELRAATKGLGLESLGESYAKHVSVPVK